MGDLEPVDNDSARTLFCGNLHHSVTEDLLYELFLQGGPIQRVFIPKAKTGGHRNYGFITYYHSISVPYAIEIFAETALFNRKLSLKPSSKTKNERPEFNIQTIERNAKILQYSNDALRQGTGANSGPVNRMPHMEPTVNFKTSGVSMSNQFDPMMLLAMGANILGSLPNALLMPQYINSSGSRSGGNNDNLKMRNDRSYGSSNNTEPYNRRNHHNRHDRNRDNEQNRHDRGGRDRRDNHNSRR